MINKLLIKSSDALRVGANAAESLAKRRLGPKWPCDPRITSGYCFLATSVEDVAFIEKCLNLFHVKDKVRVVCEQPAVRALLGGDYTSFISYEDIAAQTVPLVVLPTIGAEQKSLPILRELAKKHHSSFNIFDPYRRSAVVESSRTLRYRDTDLTLYPTVLLPTLYSNWGYINFLIDDIVGGRDVAVLDMFAGSGVIGFCLHQEAKLPRVSFCDANFWAIQSIRETAKRYPALSGRAWLSEGLSGVPADEKYDLIVGNPPHADCPLSGPEVLPGVDPAWQAHSAFFADAEKHLNPGGRIVFIESNATDAYGQFYSDLESRFPVLKIRKHTPLANHQCFIIDISLR